MTIFSQVTAYLKATGMPETLFGRQAVNDPRLVGDLRNGREPRERTRARIAAFIADHPEYRHVAPGPTRRRCSNGH